MAALHVLRPVRQSQRADDPERVRREQMMLAMDLHADPGDGNSPLCEHYMLMLRMVIEGQANWIRVQGILIADLQRRLNGEPVTQVFLDGTR